MGGRSPPLQSHDRPLLRRGSCLGRPLGSLATTASAHLVLHAPHGRAAMDDCSDRSSWLVPKGTHARTPSSLDPAIHVRPYSPDATPDGVRVWGSSRYVRRWVRVSCGSIDPREEITSPGWNAVNDVKDPTPRLAPGSGVHPRTPPRTVAPPRQTHPRVSFCRDTRALVGAGCPLMTGFSPFWRPVVPAVIVTLVLPGAPPQPSMGPGPTVSAWAAGGWRGGYISRNSDGSLGAGWTFGKGFGVSVGP